jgi:1-pyrroline-5-carboxylate dehydrogenase
VISPFNFPIEIPVLQMMGALYMGNKPLVKPDTRTSIALEQWVRMLHHCGLPKEDLDLMHSDGPIMEKVLKQADARMTLFTGSTRVGEHLTKALNGKVRLEDGGYDWKVLGPDVPKHQHEIDYVAYQSDQDAYAHTGQKCSAQSILFVHKNWRKTDLLEKMAAQASKRSLHDLTIGPILTWTNDKIKAHQDAVLELEGAKLLFGGNPLKDHSIPAQYGSWEPTAIFVPLRHFRGSKKAKLLMTEVFGPF